MTTAGVQRMARALGVVEATRKSLHDGIVCTEAQSEAILLAAQRGLCLASDLVVSVGLGEEIGKDIEALRLDGATLSTSKSLTEALVQAAALSGLIRGVSPVLSLPASNSPSLTDQDITSFFGSSETSQPEEVPPCGYI